MLAAAGAACALALWPGSAGASEVVVVDGDRAVVREDPFAPSRAETSLGRPPGRPLAGISALRPTRSRGSRAVRRALRRAARRLGRRRSKRYLGIYRRARSVRRRLRGTRGQQLGYVIGSIEGIARRRRLSASRIPVLFLQLRRNTRYWRSMRFPRGDVTFRGSQILYRYFAGRGLQIHPLATFVKANRMYGACRGTAPGPCRASRLRRLLDEMARLAVRRRRGLLAWEYLFHFGGGSPPWISGMAQATGIQAFARASTILPRPNYVTVASKGLGAFVTGPPVGVRARGFRGGPHYLQYSFAPRLYIFNAFVQALIGLHDFAQITGNGQGRALYDQAEPELRREIPASDVGDWSRYSYRGRESTHEYHELLREVLQSMCSRRLGSLYCHYARRYRSDQTDPARLEFLGPSRASSGRRTAVRFRLSKLSAVQVTIVNDGDTVLNRTATYRRGSHSVSFRPGSAGTYSVRLGAKELRTGRGRRSSTSGQIVVE